MHSYGLPKDIGALHFVGIGGIGMSGIAELLHNQKFNITGSDLTQSTNVYRLQKLNIEINLYKY